MQLKENFNQLYPGILYLEHQNTDTLAHYLQQKGWIGETEKILRVEKPGEGNMNFVMRVVTHQKSFIVKQARPWVEKYPQMAAPIERVAVEARFYQAIQTDAVLKSYTPQLLGFDAGYFTLAIEDLGKGADFTYIYQKDRFLSESEIQSLMAFISRLHHLSKPDFPLNTHMRLLNHEHIFNYPFMENNGFDLDNIQKGLHDLSLSFKQDKGLKKKIRAFGKTYLGDVGKVLIHGDYYPGSWLKVNAGVKVIDPEFGFVGRPEFDMGVMIAHLKMSEHSADFIEKAFKNYKKPPRFNEKMMRAFTGIEIMRRILGLAQLPLSLSLAQKEKLLTEARSYIL
jgi:5-methylthioribose kinase